MYSASFASFIFIYDVCLSANKRLCMSMVCVCVDAYLCYDVSVLFTCLRHIHDAMEGEAAYCFEQDLYYAADPVELAERNAARILNDPRSLIIYPAIVSSLEFYFCFNCMLLLLSEVDIGFSSHVCLSRCSS